ncbi:unnamed protein product [Adineta ricciae]|uniref:Uncharacterized protein n=1 Tax=Adineta ricciae TaxID=249248 RepID=A0A815HHQ1_ADIRI|nr:unnamed protein product [Adineta ricciae]CAF1352325.1 unnamed protein product [Adineta ricciae]
MADSSPSAYDEKNPAPSSTPQSSFLTVPYNPAAHPRQITLLDQNGQPIQYTLIPTNQQISMPPAHHSIPPQAVQRPPDGNICCICGSIAATKCSYGISRGNPCGRLLCLAHVMELPGMNGGRYPHCPEHFHNVKQNQCNVM